MPLAKIAARVMAGRTLAELGLVDDLEVAGVFVKTPVFPFVRFPGVDTILGPEMKSTGEVMGGADSFGAAFAKAQLAAGQRLPEAGTAFISVNNDDKPTVLPIARDLADARVHDCRDARHGGVPPRARAQVEVVYKVNEGRPNVARSDRQRQDRSDRSTRRSAASRSSTIARCAVSAMMQRRRRASRR